MYFQYLLSNHIGQYLAKHTSRICSSMRTKQWLQVDVGDVMFEAVHTETFSCVFVLFQVMSWLFSIPLRTLNNTKTQGNVSVCTGPELDDASTEDALIRCQAASSPRNFEI